MRRHLRRLIYKQQKFYDDDFDWDNYTSDSYARRLRGDVESRYLAVAEPGQLSFDETTGTVESSVTPLHPNHHLILEAIGQLRPASVHEVGCGGGDHLANGLTLFPDIAFTGGDRAGTQLDLALKRHPELAGRVGIQDITMPWSRAWPVADLVYSQAVLMHIHTAVSHFVALANLFRIARNQVLLMENLQCHHFVRDLLALYAGGHLAWETLHLYRFDGSTGGRAVLASSTPLDLPVPDSDDQLREGIKPSARRLRRSEEDSGRGLFGFGPV